MELDLNKDFITPSLTKAINKKKEIESLIENQENSRIGKIFSFLTYKMGVASTVLLTILSSIIIGVLFSFTISSMIGIPLGLLSCLLKFCFLISTEDILCKKVSKLNSIYSKDLYKSLIRKKKIENLISNINKKINNLSDVEKEILKSLMKNKEIEEIKNKFQLSILKEKIKESDTEKLIKQKENILNYIKENLDNKDSKQILNILEEKIFKEKEKQEKIQNSLNQAFEELEKINSGNEKVILKQQL